MSGGMTFAGGSVVSFTPAAGCWNAVLAYKGGDGARFVVPVIGWAVAVTKRDMWVVHTEVMPVGIVDGRPALLTEEWHVVAEM